MNSKEKAFKKYCEANGFCNIEFSMPFLKLEQIKKGNIWNYVPFIRRGEVVIEFDYLANPPKTIEQLLAKDIPINLSSFNRSFLKRLKLAVKNAYKTKTCVVPF